MRPDARGNSPTMTRATVDLPHPDSPTSPSVSPPAKLKLTPSTAATALRPEPYRTTRPSSSIIAYALRALGWQPSTQPAAHRLGSRAAEPRSGRCPRPTGSAGGTRIQAVV